MHPSVVLGMLQYHGLTDYRSLPRHRTPVLTKIRPELIRG